MPNTINKKNKIFCKQNIPNMLIIFRIVLTVAIVVLLLIPCTDLTGLIPKNFGDPIYQLMSPFDSDFVYTNVYLNQLLAGCFFLLACFSDWLDGFLARKYNWVTNFGKLWDPIADKILINSVLICFAYWQMIPAFIPIIMIARDIAVDADRMVAASKKVVVAANWYGKAKTVIQMIAIIAVFFFFNGRYETAKMLNQLTMWWAIQNLAMYIACVVSIISGVKYFIDIAKQTKKVKDEQPKN